MEKWDILNKNGEKTSRVAIRGKTVLGTGEYHLVVHIWIVDDNGSYLIQRRSKQKKLMPGEWAATGGAAVSGEDSFTAAARELKEELGISSDRESLKFLKRIKRRNSFVDIWVINTSVSVDELELQQGEVDEARWVSKNELKKMIENGNFHDYGKYYWSVVLQSKEKVK